MTLGDVLDFVITYIEIKGEDAKKNGNKGNKNNKEQNVKSTKFSYGRAD